MWPKLLVQLLEFLPHATRLLPMADRYLQSNAAGGKGMEGVEQALVAHAAALDGLSGQVKGSLGAVASAHLEMSTKLDEFAAQVMDIQAETKRARRAADLLITKLDGMDKQVAALRKLVIFGLAAIAILVLVVVALLIVRERALAGL